MTRDLAAMRAACEAGYVSTADYVKAKESPMTDIAERLRKTADTVTAYDAGYMIELLEIAIRERHEEWERLVSANVALPLSQWVETRNAAHADRATLLAEVERLTAQLAKCRETPRCASSSCSA